MDVKHLYGINVGFKSDNFPSFKIYCASTKQHLIYLKKLPIEYKNFLLQYFFATNYNDPVRALWTQKIHTEREIKGSYHGCGATLLDQYIFSITQCFVIYAQFLHVSNSILYVFKKHLFISKKIVTTFLCNKWAKIEIVQYEHYISTRSILFWSSAQIVMSLWLIEFVQ